MNTDAYHAARNYPETVEEAEALYARWPHLRWHDDGIPCGTIGEMYLNRPVKPLPDRFVDRLIATLQHSPELADALASVTRPAPQHRTLQNVERDCLDVLRNDPMLATSDDGIAADRAFRRAIDEGRVDVGPQESPRPSVPPVIAHAFRQAVDARTKKRRTR